MNTPPPSVCNTTKQTSAPVPPQRALRRTPKQEKMLSSVSEYELKTAIRNRIALMADDRKTSRRIQLGGGRPCARCLTRKFNQDEWYLKLHKQTVVIAHLYLNVEVCMDRVADVIPLAIGERLQAPPAETPTISKSFKFLRRHAEVMLSKLSTETNLKNVSQSMHPFAAGVGRAHSERSLSLAPGGVSAARRELCG